MFPCLCCEILDAVLWMTEAASVTKETLALGNADRKVMVYDTKGFFDTADWSFGDWPRRVCDRKKCFAETPEP